MVDSLRMNHTPTLDLAFVRQQFPAFLEPSLRDQSFFENAGGSYACSSVIDRLNAYYRKNKLQPYYPSPASTEAGRQMDDAYTRLAPWLGVAPEEIVFGPSTTQNTYVLAQAALGFLKPGDEIIVSEQEHEANSGAWRRLEQHGMVVHTWCVDPASGSLSVSDLEALLSKRTRIVAFTHCSNVIGQINPVAQITARAREVGALSMVDGVSYAAHGFPDVARLGADVYLFSLYKTFGPHQGLMVIRNAVAEQFANQSHYFNDDQRRKRLVPAGPDHAQVAASQGIADYFESVVAHHFDTPPADPRAALASVFAAAERRCLEPVLDALNAHPRVRIVGPDTPDNRAPTVSFTVDGVAPDELCAQLAEHGVMCGSGHFYAARLLDAMNIGAANGVVRWSLLHYTSDEDVERATDALHRLI